MGSFGFDVVAVEREEDPEYFKVIYVSMIFNERAVIRYNPRAGGSRPVNCQRWKARESSIIRIPLEFSRDRTNAQSLFTWEIVEDTQSPLSCPISSPYKRILVFLSFRNFHAYVESTAYVS